MVKNYIQGIDAAEYICLGPDHDLDSTKILKEFGKIFSQEIPGWPYRSKMSEKKSEE